jgi:hypothetical protein
VLGPDDAVSPAGVLRWEDPRPAEWLAWALDHIAGRPLPPPQAAGSNAQAGQAAIPGVLKLSGVVETPPASASRGWERRRTFRFVPWLNEDDNMVVQVSIRT